MLLWYLVGYIHKALSYHLPTNHKYLSPNKRHQHSIPPLQHHLNITYIQSEPKSLKSGQCTLAYIPFEEAVGDLDGKPHDRHK